ncbi:MAG: hypothetical protein GF347_05145 [Candidatus Moranbacteria bacterium]|nr:hypothetical protein [Candidatus Moranbacteria bacterium]
MVLGSAAVFLVALGWLLVGYYFKHTSITPANGGIYVEGIVGNPEFINPVIGDEPDLSIARIVFSSLMKYDKNNKLVNDLVDNWSISDDKSEYLIKIKEGVNFHDGKPLTIDDVIYTIGIIQNIRYNSPLFPSWKGVEYERVDDYTIKFILDDPYAPFLHNLTFGILPRHLWEDFGPQEFKLSKLNEQPVGSGPYRFERHELNENQAIKQFIFKANKDYYGKEAYIETVLFKFYQSEEEVIQELNEGEVMAINNLSLFNYDKVDKEQIQVHELASPHYRAVFLNTGRSEIVAADEVREALAWATCREEIVEDVLMGKGKVVYSPVFTVPMEGVEGFEKRECSVEKSKEVLEKAGWKLKEYSGQEEGEAEDEEEDGDEDEEDQEDQDDSQTEDQEAAEENGSGQMVYFNEAKDPLQFSMAVNADAPKLIETAEQLKAQWEKAGFLVNIQLLSSSELKNVVDNRDFDALIFGEFLNVDPDPMDYWHSSQKDKGANLANYKNKDADDLLVQGRKEHNEEKRDEIYRDFQLLINKDIPAVFLYSSYYLYPVNKEVKGIDMEEISDNSDRLRNINYWYIEEQRSK